MKPEPTPSGVVAAQGLIAIEGLVRIMRTVGDTYGHDYEAIVIYWSVILASIGRYMHSDELVVPLPDGDHRPVSARAIAEATGLPRETVRRKIATLVAAGHLVQDQRGVRTRPPLLEQRNNRAMVIAVTRDIKRTAAALNAMAEPAAGRD